MFQTKSSKKVLVVRVFKTVPWAWPMTLSYDVLCCTDDLAFSELNWAGLNGVSLDCGNHMNLQILLYLDSKNPTSRMVLPVRIIVTTSSHF